MEPKEKRTDKVIYVGEAYIEIAKTCAVKLTHDRKEPVSVNEATRIALKSLMESLLG